MILSSILRLILVVIVFCVADVSVAEDKYLDKDFKLSLKTLGSDALLSFELQPGAKFYWRNPGELGLATKINFDKSANLASAEVFWPIPELYQEYNVTSYIYQGKQDFVIKPMAQKADQDILLTVRANFTICKKTCDNYDISLSTEIKPVNAAMIIEEVSQALAKAPKANGSEDLTIQAVEQEIIAGQHWLKIKFTSPIEEIHPKIFLDLSEDVHFDPAKFTLSNELDAQLIRMPVTLLDNKQIIAKIYLNLVSDNGNAIEYEFINQHQESHSFIWLWPTIPTTILSNYDGYYFELYSN